MKIAFLALVWILAACDADKGDSAWCKESFTPGEETRISPDPCSPDRSPPPPLSADLVTDFCVECTPRCGATKYLFSGDEEYYTDTDLPAGACTHEGEKCDMAATAPLAECGGVVSGCAVNTYRCSCIDGRWDCVMTSQGAGVCVCGEPTGGDAGRD